MTVRRNLVSNFVGQALVGAMGLLFVPIYIAHLGVEAYALIGFFAVLQGWLALLDLGMSATLNRELARASAGVHSSSSIANLVYSIEVICVAIASSVVAIVYFASGWIAEKWLVSHGMGETTVTRAIAIMGLVIGLRFFESIYRGALLGMEHQIWFNTANVVSATTRYAGAAVLVVWITASVEAFFWFQAVISAVTVSVFAIAAHRWLPRAERKVRFSIDSLKSVALFSLGLTLTTLSGLLLTHADKLMLAKLLTLNEFGQYMLAVAIVGIFPMLIIPIVATYAPVFARDVAADAHERVITHYYKASEIVSLLIAPVSALCIFNSETIIFAWTGNAPLATQVGPILAFLSFGMACVTFLQIPFALQLAHGWTTLPLIMNAAASVLLLPLEYFAQLHYGGKGAAAAWAAINFALLPIATILMHRRLIPNECFRWMFTSIASPMICSLIVAGTATLLISSASTRSLAFANLFIIGVLAFVAVAASLSSIRHEFRLRGQALFELTFRR